MSSIVAGICLARQKQGGQGVIPKGHGTVELNRGRASFASHCAPCHGLDGRGGEHASGIVNSSTVRAMPDTALFQTIHDGIPGRGMPGFATLGDRDIAAVVRYIRSLSGQGQATGVKGDPVKGKDLFFGAAHCADCHMVKGRGGFIGPDLSSLTQAAGAEEIREKIINPNKDLPPRQQVVDVTTNEGRHFSGVLRNEDNFSLQLLDPGGTFHFFMKSDIAAMVREPHSLMPTDYGSRLKPPEIDDLVSYLVSQGSRAVPGETLPGRPGPASKHRDGMREKVRSNKPQ
jgi:cytochrome c oxidase cbb3-type subunit 3